MTQATAFLDASVLYSAWMRDLLMELAVSGVYRAKWSNVVHDEWIHALTAKRPDLPRDRLERTRDLMNAHVRDALVADFESLLAGLRLPDPNDRHVLAAAIKGRADIIVTLNLKDFPAEALTHWGLEAQHPDEFLAQQFAAAQASVLNAVRTARLRLKNPPRTAQEYLDALRGQGLLATASALTPFEEFI